MHRKVASTQVCQGHAASEGCILTSQEQFVASAISPREWSGGRISKNGATQRVESDRVRSKDGMPMTYNGR